MILGINGMLIENVDLMNVLSGVSYRLTDAFCLIGSVALFVTSKSVRRAYVNTYLHVFCCRQASTVLFKFRKPEAPATVDT
ncbi:hypothetical protein AAVH_43011 [Aphelenchoides avenae]|nr:hypothetical protein AAVH_43011 [Aphelenchus avenae]